MTMLLCKKKNFLRWGFFYTLVILMTVFFFFFFFFHNEKTFINEFKAGSYNFSIYQFERIRAFYVKSRRPMI